MQKLKALLFYATLIFIGGTIISFLTVNFLLKPSPATESPELVYAKTQAQLAELARNQESNIFWGHFFQAIAIGFALTILVGSWAAVAMIWRGFNHKIWVDQQNHRRSLTFVEPDQLGNFPLVRVNGEFVRFRPGNPAFAPPPSVAGFLPEPQRRGPRRVLRMNGSDVPFDLKEDDYTSPISGAKRLIEAGETPETLRPESAKRYELAQCKGRGEPKKRSIMAVTLAKPGENAEWQKWSAYWDKLPGPE